MANERKKKAKSAKIDEAVDVLAQFGLPHAQLNDRTAYCLLALLNLTEGMPWSNATAPLVGITPMMDFARSNYAVESVTSHGPVDSKRHIELKKLFASASTDMVYISAFPDKRTFARYASEVAWETEVWVADNPTHMVHFNGSRFLGPYV